MKAIIGAPGISATFMWINTFAFVSTHHMVIGAATIAVVGFPANFLSLL